MTYQYEHPRYTPYDKTTDMVTSVRLAQIEPTRVLANTYSTFTDIGTDSPFNPLLNSPVEYSPKVVANCAKHAPSTKYDNNYKMSNNVALYDPKIYNRDAQPYYLNNLQEKNLSKNAHDRIILKPDPREKPVNGDFSGNGFIYNPHLPESETNQRPRGMGPDLIDERLHEYHTNDRQWNYERDRAVIADNLRHSKDLEERNKRQLEADSALQKWAHRDRNYEVKQTYRNTQPTSTQFQIDMEDAKRASKQNDRIVAPDFRQKEAFALARNEFNVNDINNLTSAVERVYMPDHTERINADFLAANLKNRIEQYTTDENVKNAKGNNPMNMIEGTLRYIADTVLGAFGWNATIDRTPVMESEAFIDPKTTLNAHKAIFDSDGSIAVDYSAADRVGDDNTIPTKPMETGIKRDIYDRRDHMLVIKNGDMLDVYPDEEQQYTAVSFIDKSPTMQHGFDRHIILLDGGKFTIIQKRAEDAIFNGDKLKDDVIIVELPVAAVDHEIRERIKKMNMGSQRDKVLELTYDDFVLFTQYLVKHPELQDRLKLEQLHYRVRGNSYDEDIITNFEGKKTFTSEAVYNNLAQNARDHVIHHWKGRVEKPIEEPKIVKAEVSPLNTNIRRESMQPNQLTIPRVVGMKRGQFD